MRFMIITDSNGVKHKVLCTCCNRTAISYDIEGPKCDEHTITGAIIYG